jgi:beta-glucosidase
VESLRAGLDIEMPGPAAYFGKQMEEAVQNWQVDERQVDEAVRRILLMVIRSGRMDAPSRIPPGSVNTPGHQELARELAEQSIVLLRNEGDLLPLDAAAIGSIAVIGPNAAECRIGGGGSSFVAPPHTVSPLDGIRKRLGGRVETAYAKGCTNLVEPALMSKGFFPGKNDGPAGLTAEYFPHPDFTGTAVKLVGQESEFLWFGTGPEAGISVTEFSARLTGTLTVPVSDAYRISMSNNGRCRLLIDGKLVLDNDRGNLSYTVIWAHPVRIAMSATVELTEGNAHEIKIEYVKTQAGPDVELFTGQEFALMRLCYMPPEHPEGINEAAALAARCDAAVVCVGMPTGFESEGRDRPHMNLPGEQDDLVCAVLKANPRTVVVLNTGSPVALPWVQEAPALLQAFYMGQEGGHALASVIFGDVNPSGRLSVTYPKRLEDNPSFLDFPGSKEVFYGEGIFVGYRYYDTKDIEPLFPFGFGLSYTSFQYSRLGAPLRAERGTPVKVSVDVRNTGKRAGKEIVQLYVRDVQSSLARPPKELKGFSAIELQPGETRTLDFFLDSRAFSFYDPHEKRWIVEPGEFEILVGSSSRDIRLKKSVILQ